MTSVSEWVEPYVREMVKRAVPVGHREQLICEFVTLFIMQHGGAGLLASFPIFAPHYKDPPGLIPSPVSPFNMPTQAPSEQRKGGLTFGRSIEDVEREARAERGDV
jgi:hypothetical protein